MVVRENLVCSSADEGIDERAAAKEVRDLARRPARVLDEGYTTWRLGFCKKGADMKFL